MLALVFAVVLFVAVVGEWMGLFEAVTDRVPLAVGVAVVVLLDKPGTLTLGRPRQSRAGVLPLRGPAPHRFAGPGPVANQV